MVPVLGLLLPFAPDIYDYLTEPDVHFVFERRYQKNPVIEWNRQIRLFLKQLDPEQLKAENAPAPLLRQIGTQMAESLPAMLAAMDYKPLDSMAVKITNLSRYDLRDIRVYFDGCRGFDSYETWPDFFGSKENKELKPGSERPVTIRYRKIPGSSPSSSTKAGIIFFGEDASQCEPNVNAELSNGRSANGKLVFNTEDFEREEKLEAKKRSGLFEFAWKGVLGVLLIYIIYQIRSLRKRLADGG
jgi:hypothetical protein